MRKSRSVQEDNKQLERIQENPNAAQQARASRSEQAEGPGKDASWESVKYDSCISLQGNSY